MSTITLDIRAFTEERTTDGLYLTTDFGFKGME